MLISTILEQDRNLTYSAVAKLNEAQWLAIPDGFDNNIVWNVGHLIVVQQLICYQLSDVPMHVSKEQVRLYKTGTSPADWTQTPDISQLLKQLTEMPKLFADDLAAQKFKKYRQFTTSTGISLKSLDDAIAFNHFHEGLHLGFILAIRNFL